MNENTLLALLESREAEANAKAEWIAEWVENNRTQLLTGMLDTDAATLLAEVDSDQSYQLNQAIYLLMTDANPSPLMQLVQQLMDEALVNLAAGAWSEHVAELEDAMNEEQWERYQHRRAA